MVTQKLGAAVVLTLVAAAPALAWEPPATLRDTGLYSDWATRTVAPANLPFSPQYPLWSDGAVKARWISIPKGTYVDASDPNSWEFPFGTRVWKEFRIGGRLVETRYIERTDEGWQFVAYQWSEDEQEAPLAPERGTKVGAEVAPGVPHRIPSRFDCRACHDGRPVPVLGFSALQLSPDRDPLAPHRETPAPGAVDLAVLVRRGLVSDLSPAVAHAPPRIRAATPVARAAQGYLHGNCASCHDVRGDLASLGMDLTQRVEPAPGAGPLESAVGVTSRYRPPGARGPVPRIAPGDPDGSALVARISTRNPAAQMPPAGTHVVDEEGVRLVRAWIEELPGERPAHVAQATPSP